MGQINGFFEELFTPTERAYKGLTILFFIYGAGFGVCIMIMYMLTTSHVEADLNDDSQGPFEIRRELANQIEKRRDFMMLILFIVSVVFLGLSALSFCFKQKYKGYVGRGVQAGMEGSSSDRLMLAEQEVEAQIQQHSDVQNNSYGGYMARAYD